MPSAFPLHGGNAMERKKPDERELAARDPRYRKRPGVCWPAPSPRPPEGVSSWTPGRPRSCSTPLSFAGAPPQEGGRVSIFFQRRLGEGDIKRIDERKQSV